MPVRYVDKDGVVRSRLPQAAGTDLQAGDVNRRRADRVRNVDYSKIGNQATPKGTSATPTATSTTPNTGSATRGTRLASRIGQSVKDKATAIGTNVKTTAGKAFRSPSRVVRWGAPVWEGAEFAEDMFRGTPEDATRGNLARGIESGGRLAATLGGAKVGGAIGAAGGSFIPGPGTLVGGVVGAVAGGAAGYMGANRAGRAVFGGELPSEEWARLREEQGAPANMVPPMGQTLSTAVEEAREFYNAPVVPRNPAQKTPSATRAPQTIYRGTRDGQPYLSNVPFESGVAEPDFEQRMGTMSVVPSSFFTNRGPTPQANVDAIRAAAARGDWDALERVGAISPRSGGTGGGGGGYGGGYRSTRSDLVSEGAGMVREAQRLMQRASRSNRAFERSGLIRQADALMEGAKSLGSFGLKEDEISGDYAKASATARGEPVDPTVAFKNIAQAGLFDAERIKALAESKRISPQLLTALSAIGDGRAGMVQELLLSNTHTQLIQEMVDGIQQITTPEQLAAQLEQGIYRETPDLELLLAGAARDQGFDITIGNEEEEQGFFGRARGLLERENRAMGGLIEDEPMGFADGGFVDPMMSAMGGYGMEESLGPMGAMGMSGGMGRPDMIQVEYNQYMQGAQKLGLPQIPFEEFVALKQQQIPQAPQAPDLTQPMGAMGFAAGGFVETKNQFGYRIDPETGRSPIGQAGWDRQRAAVSNNNALRQQQAGPQPAAQPMAQPAARPAAQPAQFGGNANYGQLATSFGMNTGAVQSIRDQARTAGTVPSFGDGKPSMMSQFGVSPTSFTNNKPSMNYQSGGGGSTFMDRKAFAQGGPVDTGGKMVIDPNPNAPTDSIPAVIDGQRPAALDSGEFVIPKHAVMFHGVDKLNKLIAQAEKGPGDGTNA